MTLGRNNFFMIKISVIWWKLMWGLHISDQEMTKKLAFCCDRRKFSVYSFFCYFPTVGSLHKKELLTRREALYYGAQRLEFLGAKLCGQGGHEMVTEEHHGSAPSKWHDSLLIKTLMMFLQDLSGSAFFWEGVTVSVPSHTKKKAKKTPQVTIHSAQ